MSSLNVRTTYQIYYFTLKMSFFCNSFFRHVKKALITKKKESSVHTNFDFIACYDIDYINIEVISIQ